MLETGGFKGAQERILKQSKGRVKKIRRIIAVCNETKMKFLFGTEIEDEESGRKIMVRRVSYLALGGA